MEASDDGLFGREFYFGVVLRNGAPTRGAGQELKYLKVQILKRTTPHPTLQKMVHFCTDTK